MKYLIKLKNQLKTVSGKKSSFALLIISALIAIHGCKSTTLKKFEGEQKVKISNSKNYKNSAFINESGNRPTLNGSRWDMFNKFIFGKEERVPKKFIDVKKVNNDIYSKKNSKTLSVTWLGHSSSIIHIENNLILTDPVFSSRVSPVPFFGPERYHTSLPLDVKKFNTIDVVIISHDHYDHLDYKTIMKIHEKVKEFIVPLGVGSHLVKWGVDAKKIKELDWWDEVTTSKGLIIAATPSQHFSGRKIIDNNKTLWASWAIMGKERRVFFSGDSGYSNAFKKIGEKYGPFDITLIENGQYNEMWQRVHMLPEQSVKAHIDVKGKIMIPIHWGAYNLSIHNWYEPVERLLKAAAKYDVKIATPEVGGTVILGKDIPIVKWWLKMIPQKKSTVSLKRRTRSVALNEN